MYYGWLGEGTEEFRSNVNQHTLARYVNEFSRILVQQEGPAATAYLSRLGPPYRQPILDEVSNLQLELGSIVV